jgi:protein involved in polysaccharide export with SLBB domain
MNMHRFVPAVLAAALLPLSLLSCASFWTGANPAAPVPHRAAFDYLSTEAEIQAFSAAGPGAYLIGPGDVLVLSSIDKDFVSEQIRVAPDGAVNVVMGEYLNVTGQNLAGAEKAINGIIQKYFDNMEIKVSLLSAANSGIAVLGDVRTPGIYPLDFPLNLASAIAKAGGIQFDPARPINPKQSRLYCHILRKTGTGITVDLAKLLFYDMASFNVGLVDGDIVYLYRPGSDSSSSNSGGTN